MAITNENVQITEKSLLSLCCKDNSVLDKIDKAFFITEKANIFYDALCSLRQQEVKASPRVLYIQAQKQDAGFSLTEITKVFEQESASEEFFLLYDNLKKNFAKKKLEDLTVDLTRELGKKSDNDWDLVEDIGIQIQNYKDLIDERKQEILDLKTATEMYDKELEKRQNNDSYPDTGCTMLNSFLTEGFRGGMMTTIIGNPGSGKSSYAQYLNNKMINKMIPALYFSKELPFVVTMDRFFGQRLRRDISDLKPKDDEEISSEILEMIRVESIKMSRHDRYGLIVAPSMDINALEKVIVSFRKSTGIEDDEGLVVTLDLTTMLKDFNKSTSNKANDYEHGFNHLFMVSERTNTHFLNVVQLKRPGDKIKIKEISDLDKLRPSLEMIKNSAVIEERSRNILGVHNPYYQARKYLSEDNPLFDILDTHIEVQVLKQNTGAVGGVLRYDFDARKSLLLPITNTNTEE